MRKDLYIKLVPLLSLLVFLSLSFPVPWFYHTGEPLISLYCEWHLIMGVFRGFSWFNPPNESVPVKIA